MFLSLTVFCSTINQQIMAHDTRQKALTIVGIPITVVLEAWPSKWELKHPRTPTAGEDGQTGPMRFFESLHVEVWRDESSGRWVGLPPPSDAWKVRENFLGLKTEQDFLAFLNQYGTFSSSSLVERRWDVEDLRCWQQLFRDYMLRSPATWDKKVGRFAPEMVDFVGHILRLSDSPSISFSWREKLERSSRSGPNLAIIKADNIVGAILATIYVDHLHGTKYKFCARPDCRRPFEVSSKHKRKFCEQYCAHLQSQRQMRASQRREGKKQKHPNRHVILREA
jgi:hypothetical protein